MHGFAEGGDNNQILIHVSQCNDEYYKIRYSDNGRGLNQTQRQKIFEPFYYCQ